MTQNRTTAPATFLLRQCKFKNIFSAVREDCLLFTLCLLLAASVVTSCSNSTRIATNERGNTQIKTTKMTTKTFTRPDDETLPRAICRYTTRCNRTTIYQPVRQRVSSGHLCRRYYGRTAILFCRQIRLWVWLACLF